MPIAPNTQFDHYEILSPLGKGGMGEVYRARDTRLNREIAIKVLPAEFAQDADRLRRFEQEAMATSSLNHPNILTVYDFGNHDSNPYLVMELLEGEELRAQLDNGALPVRKAIEYAQQIAAGLAAAHEKGVVHRDLKPENLFITKDGRLKILDFGLAKMEPPQNVATGSDVATLKQLTTPGTVMGTVAYMSPEQVRGEAVDHRSDLFSFGLILFEMLCGERAFQKGTMAETMTAILNNEPPELSETNAKISPQLEKIVRRCLEKKPERRFHSAHDLGFALEALSVPSSSGANRTEAVQALNITTRRSGWRERIWMIAAGVFALLALAFGVAYVRRPSLPTAATMRLTVNPLEGANVFELPAISPDGRTLAFVARTTGTRQIWVRPLDSQMAKPLVGTEYPDLMFWSPDSQSIAFLSGGKLKKIALSGGAPVNLCDTSSLSWGTWNRDGVILFAEGAAGIKRISANGGAITGVTTVDVARGETAHRNPFFLSDGRHFLFYVEHNEPAKRGIYVRPLNGGESKQILSTDVRTVWAGVNPVAPSEGYLVFMRQGALLAQSYDFSQNQLSGDPIRIADQVRTNPAGFNGRFSLSETGILVFTEGSEKQQLVLANRAGKKLGTAGPIGSYNVPRFSPDEQRLAVGRFDPQSQSLDIRLLDLARGTDTRFTFDPAEDSSPLWSPDGTRLAWASLRSGVRDLYWKAANGAGEDELLFKSAYSKIPQDWSKDGRFILYQESDPQTSNDLWILPLEGERKPWLWLKTEFTEQVAKFSSDGKWIAYTSNESGRFEVYVRAFVPGAPASGGKWQISTNGGSQAKWRRDGRELYYVSTDYQLMAVDLTLGAEVKAGTPKALFDLRDLRASTAGVGFTATSDGQRFLFVTSAEDAYLTPFTVVTNWMAEMKK